MIVVSQSYENLLSYISLGEIDEFLSDLETKPPAINRPGRHISPVDNWDHLIIMELGQVKRLW